MAADKLHVDAWLHALRHCEVVGDLQWTQRVVIQSYFVHGAKEVELVAGARRVLIAGTDADGVGVVIGIGWLADANLRVDYAVGAGRSVAQVERIDQGRHDPVGDDVGTNEAAVNVEQDVAVDLVAHAHQMMPEAVHLPITPNVAAADVRAGLCTGYGDTAGIALVKAESQVGVQGELFVAVADALG